MNPLYRPLLGTLAGLLLGAPLAGQGTFLNADQPGAKVCPRIEDNATELHVGGAYNPTTTGGLVGAQSTSTRFYQEGSAYFLKGERKDVGAFAAHPQKGDAVHVRDLKGKIVLVCLWSTQCQPSASLLMELADIYSKREKFGFDVLAVNFDKDRWTKIVPFMRAGTNKKFFEGLPIYTVGLGKEGANNFMDEIYSVPLLAVIDREGKLASLTIGYTPNMVAVELSKALREKAPGQP